VYPFARCWQDDHGPGGAEPSSEVRRNRRRARSGGSGRCRGALRRDRRDRPPRLVPARRAAGAIPRF
jgi:hypothetical protein